jgi:hypothetical protein
MGPSVILCMHYLRSRVICPVDLQTQRFGRRAPKRVLREVALKNTGESRGQYRGIQDYGSFFLGTMRYSLRRALLLDSVDGCTRNLTILKIPLSFPSAPSYGAHYRPSSLAIYSFQTISYRARHLIVQIAVCAATSLQLLGSGVL